MQLHVNLDFFNILFSCLRNNIHGHLSQSKADAACLNLFGDQILIFWLQNHVMDCHTFGSEIFMKKYMLNSVSLNWVVWLLGYIWTDLHLICAIYVYFCVSMCVFPFLIFYIYWQMNLSFTSFCHYSDGSWRQKVWKG